MATVDFGSELGATWEVMARTSFLANKPVRTRPAVDRREKLLADEANRYVERLQYGYSGAPSRRPHGSAENGEPEEAATCDHCGQQRPLSALYVYDTWRLSGGVQSVLVPRYRCVGDSCRKAERGRYAGRNS